MATPPQPNGSASQQARQGSAPPTANLVLRWPDDAGVRVVLWGPSGSGKTTFYWALLAAADRGVSVGGWQITPRDAVSRALAATVFRSLSMGGVLPSATLDLEQPTSWTLTRLPQAARRPPRNVPGFLRGEGWQRRNEELRITVHLQDLPGAVFDFAENFANRATAVSQLANADAFVYLHHALQDDDDQSPGAAGYFRNMLDAIRDTLPPDTAAGRLDQHLAVCVTKFDHPAVFDPAYDNAFATLAPEFPHTPVVTADNAHAYFDWLCAHYSYSRQSDLVRAAVHQRFRADRVRYYATSALGYHRAEHAAYDHRYLRSDDPASAGDKTVPQVALGPVHPVNVLEPLGDLARAVLKSPIRAGTAGQYGGRP